MDYEITDRRKRCLIAFTYFSVVLIILTGEYFLLDSTPPELKSSTRNFSSGENEMKEQFYRDQVDKVFNQEDHFQLFSYAFKGNESLLPKYPSHLVPSTESWQIVNETNHDLYVYSAFLDRRDKEKLIRVTSITKFSGHKEVWCRLWYKVTNPNSTNETYKSKTVEAKVNDIHISMGYAKSIFILCPLETIERIPVSVSIVGIPEDNPTNLLKVINIVKRSIDPRNMGICVKPLLATYNQSYQLLEFIELNRILGIKHFTFYDHNLGPEVQCILNYYTNKGVVTVLPWNSRYNETIPDEIYAALNDCIYRQMYKSSYLLLIDLDEFIIPKEEDTLPELIVNLNLQTDFPIGSYAFQVALFNLYWKDDEEVQDLNDPITDILLTLKKTQMKSKLHRWLSKLICRPEGVVETSPNMIKDFLPGYHNLNVDPQRALVHRYNYCESANRCLNDISKVDKSVYRYKKMLIEAVGSHYKNLKDKCGLSSLLPKLEHSVLN